MLIEKDLTKTGSMPASEEATNIVDEMESLLREMQETMSVIKRILDKDSAAQSCTSSIAGRSYYHDVNNVVHGS